MGIMIAFEPLLLVVNVSTRRLARDDDEFELFEANPLWRRLEGSGPPFYAIVHASAEAATALLSLLFLSDGEATLMLGFVSGVIVTYTISDYGNYLSWKHDARDRRSRWPPKKPEDSTEGGCHGE